MTTGDPRRLMDSAPAGDPERVLIESAGGSTPTDAQCDALWASLRHQLPSIGEGGPPGRGPDIGVATIAKATLLVIAAGVASLTLGLALSRGGPTKAKAAAAVRASAAVASPLAPEPEVASARPETTATASSGLGPDANAPPRTAPRRERPAMATPALGEDDALHDEVARILLARKALRAGDCGAALFRLNEARTLFPAGVLSQEREVLTVETLGCAGREAEAADRADAFLREYPSSPLAELVRRFAR
jgi:hypothetical protein